MIYCICSDHLNDAAPSGDPSITGLREGLEQHLVLILVHPVAPPCNLSASRIGSIHNRSPSELVPGTIELVSPLIPTTATAAASGSLILAALASRHD